MNARNSADRVCNPPVRPIADVIDDQPQPPIGAAGSTQTGQGGALFFSQLVSVTDPVLAARFIASILPSAHLVAPAGPWIAELRTGVLPDAYMLRMLTNEAVELRDLVLEGRQLFFFVLDGAGSVTTHDDAWGVSRYHAASVESTQGVVVRAEAGCACLCLAVRRSALLRRLTLLTQRPLLRPLAFDGRFEMATTDAPAVVDFVSGLLGPTVGRVLMNMPEGGSTLSDLLLDVLLLALPHNYSLDLKRRTGKVAPRHVKRAIEFIEANARSPISIEALADICQVSPRALQYGFKSFLGLAPADYIRAVRLRLAREAILRDARPLTAIAQDWGFTNFSRFSAQFRAAFGEAPSALRRRRRS